MILVIAPDAEPPAESCVHCGSCLCYYYYCYCYYYYYYYCYYHYYDDYYYSSIGTN